jgi:hypothetical protein
MEGSVVGGNSGHISALLATLQWNNHHDHTFSLNGTPTSEGGGGSRLTLLEGNVYDFGGVDLGVAVEWTGSEDDRCAWSSSVDACATWVSLSSR